MKIGLPERQKKKNISFTEKKKNETLASITE